MHFMLFLYKVYQSYCPFTFYFYQFYEAINTERKLNEFTINSHGVHIFVYNYGEFSPVYNNERIYLIYQPSGWSGCVGCGSVVVVEK